MNDAPEETPGSGTTGSTEPGSPEVVSAAGPADGYWYQPPPVWVAKSGGAPSSQYGQHTPTPRKGNSAGVSSIIVSCTSLAFLLFTAGIAAPLTLIASAVSIFLGHKGKTDFDEGKADSNRDVAIAGFWTGITGVVLSVLALIAWVLIIALAIASDPNSGVDSFHEFEWD